MRAVQNIHDPEVLYGEDASILGELDARLCAGQRISWRPNQTTSTQHRDQLSPLSSYLVDTQERQDVTVVIPTHRRTPLGLEAFCRQAKEVLVLWNGAQAIEYPAIDNLRWIHVPWQEHGKTRDLALSLVRTPYVFFSVDDAIPMGDMLYHLVQQYTDKWDAVVARQIPRPTADAYTKDALYAWTPPARDSYVMSQCDHVGTIYKMDTLKRYPIPHVCIAEDVAWSMDKRIGCVPQAVLVHSHPRKMREIWKREWDIHRQLERLQLPVPRVGLLDIFTGGLAAMRRYGIQEGYTSAGQIAVRLAAQRYRRHITP